MDIATGMVSHDLIGWLRALLACGKAGFLLEKQRSIIHYRGYWDFTFIQFQIFTPVYFAQFSLISRGHRACPPRRVLYFGLLLVVHYAADSALAAARQEDAAATIGSRCRPRCRLCWTPEHTLLIFHQPDRALCACSSHTSILSPHPVSLQY